MVVLASVEEGRDVGSIKMFLMLLLMKDSIFYLENLKYATVISN